jgi:hypothetical protein
MSDFTQACIGLALADQPRPSDRRAERASRVIDDRDLLTDQSPMSGSPEVAAKVNKDSDTNLTSFTSMIEAAHLRPGEAAN